MLHDAIVPSTCPSIGACANQATKRNDRQARKECVGETAAATPSGGSAAALLRKMFGFVFVSSVTLRLTRRLRADIRRRRRSPPPPPPTCSRSAATGAVSRSTGSRRETRGPGATTAHRRHRRASCASTTSARTHCHFRIGHGAIAASRALPGPAKPPDSGCSASARLHVQPPAAPRRQGRLLALQTWPPRSAPCRPAAPPPRALSSAPPPPPSRRPPRPRRLKPRARLARR